MRERAGGIGQQAGVLRPELDFEQADVLQQDRLEFPVEAD